jgi:hypothetical protein
LNQHRNKEIKRNTPLHRNPKNNDQLTAGIATGMAAALTGSVLAIPIVGFAPLGVAIASIVAVAAVSKYLNEQNEDVDDQENE